jgi:hypothetical protein
MNEDVFNISVRKFLKELGVTSQRELEKAVRAALADGRIRADQVISVNAVVSAPSLGLKHTVEAELELK